MRFPRLLTLLSLGALLGSSAIGAELQQRSEADQFTEHVRPFLERHCFACHNNDDAEAAIDLSSFSAAISNSEEAQAWLKVLTQLQADLMPPSDEERPDSQERSRTIRWIENSVLSAGFGDAYRKKMLLPGFGNYIDHELLFSGQIKALPFTPARIWRNSPYIFDANGQVSRHVKGIQNPFTFSTPANNIRDYSFSSDVGASVVETILLNANAEIDYQFEEAKRHLENPTPNQRRPNLFAPFLKQTGEPNDEQIAAVISATFHRRVSRLPNEVELTKYGSFFHKNLRETSDSQRSLKATLTAVYLSPEAIYRMEWGLGPTDEHGRRLLSPNEIAYALSYALFDAAPTEGGRNANEKVIARALAEGKLISPQDVATAVREILRTEQYQPIGGQVKNNLPRIMRFFHEFFGYHRATEVFKDAQRVNEHGLYHSPRRLVSDADNLLKVILREDKDVFLRLLTTNQVLVFHSGDNQAQFDRHENLLADLKSYDEDRVSDEIRKRKAGVLKKPKYKSNPQLVAAEHARIERDGKTLLAKKKSEYEKLLKSGVSMQPVKSRDYSYIRAYSLDTRRWKWPAVQPFELPKEQRAGILTHPAWLVAHSVNDDNDPIHRGIWVYEKLLAGVIPDVPPDVDARVPADPHKTLRERLAGLRETECWKCHRKINPLGEPFEMFDDFGRFRTQHYFDEQGQLVTATSQTVPAADGSGTTLKRIDYQQLVQQGKFSARKIDSSGSFDGLGIAELSGDFDGAVEMIHAIAKTNRARQSIIRHLFRYFMGRNEMLSDSQTLIDADRAYVENGGSLQAVLVSLLSSDSFLYRR